MAKRVAIVGSGIAGLVAIKSCREEGLEPVCFEQHDDIGGLWYKTDNFRPGQSIRIYDSLILNTSKDMCCYSDFPFPKEAPPFPTGQDMHAYLKDYAEAFDLFQYVHFSTKVLNVIRNPDYETTGRWEIETDNNGDRKWTTFDAVLVCTGFYNVPTSPVITGMDKFKGTVTHARTYSNAIRYSGRRVLIVGNAHSAGDLAVDISKQASQVYLALGSGTIVISRLLNNGIPLDFMLNRVKSWLPFASLLLGKFVISTANSRLDHKAYKLWPDEAPPIGAVMINDEIPMRLACGRVIVAGKLDRFDEKNAYFTDGTSVKDIDDVIMCTGMDRKLPFLDPIVGADDNILNWYKMVFPVHLPHDTLALIGFCRTVGPITPIFELQARLAARVLAGKHQLPDREVMRSDVNKLNDNQIKKAGRCKYSFPNLPFRDELAKELGVVPSLFDLLKLGPSVAYQYYFCPGFNVHHRLVGPGAWSGAVRACAEAQHGGCAKQLRKLPVTSSGGGKVLTTFSILLLVLFLLFLTRYIFFTYVSFNNT